jgi:hypothetical protein
MKYFHVVLSGSDIYFEHYGADGQAVIGFVYATYIKANTQEDAISMAKHHMRIQWNQRFNSERKIGMPTLTLEDIKPHQRWRSPKREPIYRWLTEWDQKSDVIQQLTPPVTKKFWTRFVGSA